MKIDSIRYCWLSTIGGIYSDLDITPIRNMELLLRYLDAYSVVDHITRKDYEKGTLSLVDKMEKLLKLLEQPNSNSEQLQHEMQHVSFGLNAIAELPPKFSAMLPKTYPMGVSNDFIIGATNSQFFSYVIKQSQYELLRWKILDYIPLARYAYIMLTTGPLFLSGCYRDFILAKLYQSKF